MITRDNTMEMVVKMGGTSTIVFVTPRDTVQEWRRKVQDKMEDCDVNTSMILEDKMLGSSDIAKDCGIADGSMMYLMAELRGGEVHKQKKRSSSTFTTLKEQRETRLQVGSLGWWRRWQMCEDRQQ